MPEDGGKKKQWRAAGMSGFYFWLVLLSHPQVFYVADMFQRILPPSSVSHDVGVTNKKQSQEKTE